MANPEDLDGGVVVDAEQSFDALDVGTGDEYQCRAEGPRTFYADGDGDGFGGETSVSACTAPTGYAEASGDCDDSSAEVHPGASELCNTVDDDCDPSTSDGLGDCNGLLCNNGACAVNCTNNAGCVAGLECGGTKCTGKLAIGAQCGLDTQCASASCGTTSICQQPGTTGSGCNSPEDCAAGSSCAAGKCRADNGHVCSADSDCLSGSCVGTCQAPVGLGGACNSAADCQANTACDGQLCKRTTGQPCGTDLECLSGSCAPEGTCRVPAGLNATCNGAPDCSTGFTCDQSVCKRDNGGACAANQECLSGSCYSLRCRAPGKYNDFCEDNQDCDGTLNGTCRLICAGRCKLDFSCPCTENSHCASLLCDTDNECD